MSQTIVELDNISFIISKEDDESLEQFYSRCWYISKLKPKNNKEFDEAVIKSKIKSNIDYLENTYSSEITNLL
tara:strand:- start:492 stop:710 length:219 start_codon:yes stop_codon:yes gene_type:complete